jgi:MFS family permease
MKIATLGAFALGNSIGWSSPASRRLQGDCSEVDFEVSSSDFAWVGSLLTVGAALSTFPAGFFVDWIGRRSTMFYIAFPYIAGWIIITTANGVHKIF